MNVEPELLVESTDVRFGLATNENESASRELVVVGVAFIGFAVESTEGRPWCNKNEKRIAYAKEELTGGRYPNLLLFALFLVPLLLWLFLVDTCFCVWYARDYGPRSFDGLDAEKEKGEIAEFMDKDCRLKLWRFRMKNWSLQKEEWKFCRKELKIAEGDDWIWKKNVRSDSPPIEWWWSGYQMQSKFMVS